MKTYQVSVVVASFLINALLLDEAGKAQQDNNELLTSSQAIEAIKKLDDDVSADENRISLQFHDDLTGEKLRPLRSLPKLKVLWLSWSKVDDVSLSHLRDLKQLQTLGLDAAKITDAGLVNLKDLVDLKQLTLEQTKIGSKGLDNIKRLTKLELLNLERTKTDDAGLAHLKNLKRMNELNLTFTKITGAGLIHLKDMTKLESLDLCYTRVDSKGLEYLKQMKQLQYLRLFNTDIDDQGMIHLSDLTKLQDLSLHCTDISDSGLVHLKALKELTTLTLNGTRITDKGLVHLAGLKKLKTLFLNDQVTNAGMMKLKAKLPDCDIGRYDKETNKVTADVVPKMASKPDSTTAKGTNQSPTKSSRTLPQAKLRAPRVWTDVTGNFKLKARFIRKEGGFLVFQRADNGREFRLTMGTISKEDREFLEKELGVASKTKKPKTTESEPARPGQLRTWTDSTDRFKINARFIELNGKIVVLERDDNRKKIEISLDRLSKLDQQFLSRLNESNKTETRPQKNSRANYPRKPKSKSRSIRSTQGKSRFKARPDGVLAIAGFNSRTGLGTTTRTRGVYPLDQLNKPGGAMEFGWNTPWPPSPKASFQTQTVFEGDGALHLAGTANYGRSFAGPIAGMVEIEQVVCIPKGGNLTCYVWEKNSTSCGPMWRLENGKFRTLDGDGRGSGKWHITGIESKVGEWTKVVIEIDEPRKRWKLKLPDKNYVSPELRYRGTPKQLLMINYLTETPPGIFIDAVKVLVVKKKQ